MSHPTRIAFNPSFQPPIPPSTLKPPRRRNKYNHQTTHNQRARNHTHQHNTPTTRRKPAADNIVLRLKVPVEPDQQHDDADADEGGAERLA